MVARVVRVAVQRLGAQQLVPGMEEGNALREKGQALSSGIALMWSLEAFSKRVAASLSSPFGRKQLYFAVSESQRAG